MRVWDLRRGDYDDNRFSPSASGFRSLLLSTALEFNYLKAPLTFLVLIIGPALIVGMVPSLIVTYGQALLHTASFARNSLVLDFVLLAVLVTGALLIGRPLLTAAFGQFRQLHYTLVFPIFVALREVVRSCTEQFGGRSMSHEQLSQMRRVGAVIAALLFAIGGATLALKVEFTAGFKAITLDHAGVWAVVKATLANAAVIVGFSTTLESLYWLWRELKLSEPVLDWIPAEQQAGETLFRIAHLSDLHLVGERYGYRMETGIHGPRGNHSFRNALRRLSAMQTASPIDRVVVTGDITDAGTRAEWAEFIDLLRDCQELRGRLSFVPGNHDVNIVDRTNPGRLDLPWGIGPALRKLRFVLGLDAVQGDRMRLVDRGAGSLGPSLRDYLLEGRRRERLRQLAENGAIRGRWEMARIWDEIFPLIEPPANQDGFGLILIDSNASSNFSLTNAIGFVTPSQLKAVKSVLRNSPGRAWILVLHHQVVEYPVVGTALRDRVGLALVNAPDLLAAIAPHASRLIILHGHRHRDWIGTYGQLVLCSAPSVTMTSAGAEESRGSFHVHELQISTEGKIRLSSTERIRVA